MTVEGFELTSPGFSPRGVREFYITACCEDGLALQGRQAAGAGGLSPSALCGRFVL